MTRTEAKILGVLVAEIYRRLLPTDALLPGDTIYVGPLHDGRIRGPYIITKVSLTNVVAHSVYDSGTIMPVLIERNLVLVKVASDSLFTGSRDD